MMNCIKIILLCCIISIFSCKKIDTPIQQIVNKDIFEKAESIVVDGQDIEFKLETNQKYTFILYDSTTQNVIFKEKFIGLVGNNVKKIYTKSLSQKSLYLYLTDENNIKIKQTKIIIN